jgi:hypothetical protein
VAEKFCAGGMEAGFIYERQKKWAKAKAKYPVLFPSDTLQKRVFRCSRVYDTGSHL